MLPQFAVSTNSVLVGTYPNNESLTSISNNFYDGSSNLTWTQIGYGLFAVNGTPVTTIADHFDFSTGSSNNLGSWSNVASPYPAVTINGSFGQGFGVSLGINATNFFSNGSYTMAPMNLKNLPTACTGLATGTIWNNSNVLNVCP